jgi:hypothetical protein
MKKSNEFDNILDECLERLLVKGETVEQCLQSFPEHTNEFKPLLETALAAKEASDIQLSPEFRDRARYQFYSALQAMESKKSWLVFAWRPLWTTMVASILVFLLAGGGTVMAAGGSMPDEPLYPVKLATEQVRLVLTPSALGKAALYAKLTDRRVLEIIRMADKDKPKQIERTARRLDIYLAKIAELASPQEVVSVQPEAMLAQEALAPKAVSVPKEAALAPGEAPTAEEVPTRQLAPALGSAPLLSARAGDVRKAGSRGNHYRARLRATMRSHAANHPARLRAILKRVPPSAKPALVRAIAVSETGYEKALRSLD